MEATTNTETPVAKKAAPKKTVKKAAKKAAGKKGGAKRTAAPRSTYEGKKIKLLVKENPKRGKAAKRFSIYKNGLPVEQYFAKGGTSGDLRWDMKHKYITLH